VENDPASSNIKILTNLLFKFDIKISLESSFLEEIDSNVIYVYFNKNKEPFLQIGINENAIHLKIFNQNRYFSLQEIYKSSQSTICLNHPIKQEILLKQILKDNQINYE
jgi:hypothetical protein